MSKKKDLIGSKFGSLEVVRESPKQYGRIYWECHCICGKNSIRKRQKNRANSPSLDRLIPEFGYTKKNIKVISYKANTIKQNASWQEIMAVANWVRKEEEESQCRESTAF